MTYTAVFRGPTSDLARFLASLPLFRGRRDRTATAGARSWVSITLDDARELFAVMPSANTGWWSVEMGPTATLAEDGGAPYDVEEAAAMKTLRTLRKTGV